MYFQNSVGFSNQRNFFYYLMTMRKVIDQFIACLFIGNKDGCREQEEEDEYNGSFSYV